MDAAPPPPPPSLDHAPPYVYAATDERPRGPREIELCAKASRPDWLYLGLSLVADAGAITLDNLVKYNGSIGVRQLGPSAVGLAWGWTLGGAYLVTPKCATDWVSSSPPEGDVRTSWEMAVAFTVLAGLTAPIVVGTEIGGAPPGWTDGERRMRVVLSSGFAVAGSLLPYLLPPKTVRAARELEHLRAGTTADGHGGFVSWSVRF